MIAVGQAWKKFTNARKEDTERKRVFSVEEMMINPFMHLYTTDICQLLKGSSYLVMIFETSF